MTDDEYKNVNELFLNDHNFSVTTKFLENYHNITQDYLKENKNEYNNILFQNNLEELEKYWYYQHKISEKHVLTKEQNLYLTWLNRVISFRNIIKAIDNNMDLENNLDVIKNKNKKSYNWKFWWNNKNNWKRYKKCKWWWNLL